MRPVFRLNPILSRPWFLLLQPLFRRLLLLFFPLSIHLPLFPKAKGIMSNDITIRSLFLSAVSVRTKVILLKHVTLVNVFFRTLLLRPSLNYQLWTPIPSQVLPHLSLYQIYRIWLIRFIFHLPVHPTLLFLRYQVHLLRGFLILLTAII